MLQVARLAPSLLQEAAEPLAQFLRAQFNDDGGARDRAGKSDLYYTVFALEGLIALRQDPPVEKVRPYLSRFGLGEDLDFVHLTCLARCWAALGKARPRTRQPAGRDILGGAARFHPIPRVRRHRGPGPPGSGTATIAHRVLEHQSPDGSFPWTTPDHAGAVTLLHHIGADIPKPAVDWLLARASPKGGFLPAPDSPVPDLLSTATALHALAAAHASIGALKDPMLDFVDTLWTGKGFCGSWADDAVDSEYTYYALLALGHLSLS
jgi:prenyltransferase beta subunit